MSKLINYWNSFDRNYDELEKEGQNFDDLLLKSKFQFLSGKYTFSSKSKFNFGEKNNANHELGLKYKDKNGTIDLKEK